MTPRQARIARAAAIAALGRVAGELGRPATLVAAKVYVAAGYISLGEYAQICRKNGWARRPRALRLERVKPENDQ